VGSSRKSCIDAEQNGSPKRHTGVRRILDPLFLVTSVALVLLVVGCSGSDSVSDVAAAPRPAVTPTTVILSLVPDPSPTPFVVPTIVVDQPTPTPGSVQSDGDDGDDAQADASTDPTPTAVPIPTATPRPIPTAVPTPTASAIVVSPTPRPVQPTAVPPTAVPPTAVPTTPAANYVEVGCTISDRNIVVDEVITLKAFQSPAHVPINYSFDHGDGTIDRTPESRAFYRAPGRYDVVMKWEYGGQNGRTFCGTVVVAGNPTPTTPAAVQIGCSVSKRDLFVGEVTTLQAFQDPVNVPVSYVFDHGDGTLDPNSQSQAYYRDVGTYNVRLEWAHSGQSGTLDCGTVTVKGASDLRGYLTLSTAQAEARAASDGLVFRILRIDDEQFAGTTDYRVDRVNVEIDNGIVTKVWLG